MKTDNQHLDFLISQYVDGCLDATSKKSLEQGMLVDPKARQMLAEHREVQDLLDDWGNRIPWINWDQFDQQLAARLEKESVGGNKITFWRQWGKVTAVAASLLLAVGVGYSWRALSSGGPVQPSTNGKDMASAVRGTPVVIEKPADDAATHGSMRSVRFDDYPKAGIPVKKVDILAPADVAVIEALNQTIDFSVQNRAAVITQPNAVTANKDQPTLPEAPPFP